MPEWRNEILRRLAGAQLRPEREAEIVDEVAQHLDDRYREKAALGQPPAQAAADAWAELDGDGVLAREIARAEPAPRPMPPVGAPANGAWIASLWQDFRYSVRRLRKRPLFAATAIVTVALTVGPATAVIGMADAVFLQMPAGVSAPDRLVLVHFALSASARGYSPWALSNEMADGLVANSKTLSGITAQGGLAAGVSTGGVEARRVEGQAVKANYFALMGVRLAAGRGLAADEDATPGGVTSIVLSANLAQELFASEQAAIGKSVLLNGVTFFVVGVADPEFRGINRLVPANFWVPSRAAVRIRHLDPASWVLRPNRGPSLEFVVRLAPGARVEGALAELDAAAKRLPDSSPTSGVRAQAGLAAPASTNANALRTVRLLAMVCGALVILGIANMANLMISQGVKMRREGAIRKALGASFARLVQLTIVESLILSCSGAALGVLVAFGIRATLEGFTIWGIGTPEIPLDWRVLGATSVMAIVAGFAFGVGPALIAAATSATGALGRGDRPGASRIRQILASAQLAVSLMLVIGALLFLGTLRNLRGVDLGFNASNVTTMRVDLRSHGYDKPRTAAYYRQIVANLKGQSGVDAVAIAYAPPMVGGSFYSSLYVHGTDPKSAPEVTINYITDGFFDTLRTPLARGRAFTTEESPSVTDATVVVLSSGAAALLFGDADPIGRVVVQPGRPSREYTVVGVAADVRSSLTKPEETPVAYFPFSPATAVSGAVVIARSSRPSGDVRKVLQATAAALDPSVPLYRDQTLDQIVDAGIAEQRLFAWVLSLLGAIAFLLAAVGLYGLVSQMVAERSREFGIRIAIGASSAVIVRLLLRQAGVVAVAGTAIGLVGAFLSRKVLDGYLFGVTSGDPLTYAGAAVLLLVVVAVAMIGPARTALNVQPVSVLRNE